MGEDNMPKNTRYIKAIEDKLHFNFPEHKS